MNQYKAFKEYLDHRAQMTMEDQIYWAIWEEHELLDEILREKKNRYANALDAQRIDTNQYYKNVKIQMIKRKYEMVTFLIEKNKSEQLAHVAKRVEQQKVETEA